jgi:anaerobic selenocysteine-containing dehydrogenase
MTGNNSSLPVLQSVRGACSHDCPDTCSWIVEVDRGEAKRLYGNPDHPFTKGTLCAKVNSYLERVYHPDRLLTPLRRTGRKGDGKFEPVSWESALADVATRWKQIIEKSGAEAILPYSSAGNQGMVQMASLDRRLFGALGCSNLERGICGEVAGIGLTETNGSPFGVDPEELVHSRYIVLWGTNTIVTNLHMWPIIAEARRRGAELVVVDPIRTRTAEQADWHIALRPASDAALAIGMMHILFRDDLIDHDYVDRFANGLESLAERALEYPPDRVAELTGLSAGEIERFTREYAGGAPSMIRPLIGPEHHRNGAMIFRTLACLPVLTGAWKYRGGGLARSTGALQYSVLNNSALLMPGKHAQGARTLNMRDLGEILCSRQLDPPVLGLCLWNTNPVLTIPNQNRIVEGLQREDLFTIVHDLFVTETARFADYIFPATSQIEHLDILPAWGHHYLSLNRPAIAPRGESVSNTEFFRRLARALGRNEPWLQESDEELVRTAMDSQHPWLEGITFERLWEEGFARLNHPRDWRPYADGFPTADRKARLWSDSLAERGLDPLPAPGEIRKPRPGELQLISGKTLYFMNGSYANMEKHCRREGTLFIEINAEDASERGLQQDDPVEVANDAGKVVARCQISDRVRPGVAWMPFGGWGDAAGNPVSVNVLTPEEPTDWGGGSGFYDAFVRVARASI